jgi:hypothetical protein
VNWIAKAILQKTLSLLPFGSRLNYFLQTKITRNLPVNDTVFNQKAAFAKKHAEMQKQHDAVNLDKAVVYEFGGGYDMLVPLNLFMAGARRQIVTDIKPLIKPALINDAIERLGLKGRVSPKKNLQENLRDKLHD